MSLNNPRIKNFNMTAMDAILLLAGGNPGAIRVLCDLFQLAPTIDPRSALGNWGPLLHLDSMDVYEHNILRLYKDVCGQDYYRMMGVMRANQLGFVSLEKVTAAINAGSPDGLGIDSLLAQVKDQLPEFQIAAPAPEAGGTNDA